MQFTILGLDILYLQTLKFNVALVEQAIRQGHPGRIIDIIDWCSDYLDKAATYVWLDENEGWVCPLHVF